ncbi:MAG: CBS domain-containing protein, partial [Candidatus Acidiferrales bacterium]
GGYKTPLTAVVFVAEATGGHAYIIPALIGAAVAYAVSGEASVSGDQRLHEGVKIAELSKIAVSEVMHRSIISVDGSIKLRDFVDRITAHHVHSAYPVYVNNKPAGIISVSSLGAVPPEKWKQMSVSDLVDSDVPRVAPECDLEEALRLLLGERGNHMLLVVSSADNLDGILTKSDVLSALKTRGNSGGADAGHETHATSDE